MSESLERLKAALADRYAIEREIGAGGMATVYLARDLRHERQVAVKVLRPDIAATVGSERFLQEVRVTANLQHPHIAPRSTATVFGAATHIPPRPLSGVRDPVHGTRLESRIDDGRGRPPSAEIPALGTCHA